MRSRAGERGVVDVDEREGSREALGVGRGTDGDDETRKGERVSGVVRR